MRDVEKAAGFLNLFADNVSAGMDVEPIEWILENVVDQQSARSTHIDFTLSPFLLEPIDKFLNDGTVRHINLMAPTGSRRPGMPENSLPRRSRGWPGKSPLRQRASWACPAPSAGRSRSFIYSEPPSKRRWGRWAGPCC